jgi:ArpU family phage transcriptional regulator
MMKEYFPKINAKATKKEVEKALYKYRDYLITLPMHLMPKITPSYSITPPSTTNSFYSSTEDVALERIQYETERNNYINYIHEAVNSLKETERQIIIRKYMQNGELGYDREIMMDMGLGKTRYCEIKGEAILRLAFALKVEVYKKNEVKAS